LPPRYAYWTILIDNAPTAFRAHEREELLPTLAQLRRKNPNAEMKWFAQGRLWASPEEAQAARRARPPQEPRGTGWRPGGKHEDPRDRFRKKTRERRERDNAIDQRGERGDRAEGAAPPSGRGFRPRENRADREGTRPPFRPKGPGGSRKPWGKPPFERTRSREGDRRDDHRGASGSRPAGSRPPSTNFRPKGPGGPRKPWSGRPQTGGERAPFNPKSPGGPRKPWGRPPADRSGGFRPREDRPAREGERRPSNRSGEFRARDNRGGQHRPWPREDRPPRGRDERDNRSPRPREERDNRNARPRDERSRDERPRTSQPPPKTGGWRPFKPKGPRGPRGKK
jgi:23S rRNA pseudouridine2605 synthase